MSICLIRLSVKRLCVLACASTLALGLGLASPVAAQQVTLDRQQALLALDHADPARRLEGMVGLANTGGAGISFTQGLDATYIL